MQRARLLPVAVALLVWTGGSAAHPHAPAWTKAELMRHLVAQDRRSGEVTERRACTGVAPVAGRGFHRFRCVERAVTGVVTTVTYHVTADAAPDRGLPYGDRYTLPDRRRMIARASASGMLAIATGALARPSNVQLQVGAVPDQLVEVSWTAVCFKSGSGATATGDYRDYSDVQHAIVLPVAAPERCSVSVSAMVGRNARLTVRAWSSR